MQQYNDKPARPIIRPRLGRTRFIGLEPERPTANSSPLIDDSPADLANDATDTPTATIKKLLALPVSKSVRLHLPSSFQQGNWNAFAEDISDQSTSHLMQLSGMMRPLRKTGTSIASPSAPATEVEEDGYWPLGIQQSGPLPIINLYGSEPFGRTLPPAVPVVMPGVVTQAKKKSLTIWQRILSSPAFKVSMGLLVGLVLLFLVSRFIDLPQTLQIVSAHLSTPQGIALALLAGLAYLAAHSIRGLRWKLFLNPIGRVSTLKVIELYQVAIFLNFLLPVRAGEAAKSLVLKRIARIPISKSLPTVAIDKSLDLMPALVIMALVPLLGIHMDLQLWLVLALAGSGLVGVLIFVGLAAWKRSFAINLLQKVLGLLPRSLSTKIEDFAIGFVDALLAGASRPKIFLLAILLTFVAVLLDGLFALLAFWTIGFPVSFATVLFGYTVYNVFYILPTPPGQVGSNEAVGLLVFSGLLRLPSNDVTAMYLFSHPWAALLMTAVGLSCLAALGLTISSAMKVQSA
jgi:uncharacterized protein (TIRG00374 family)